MTCPLASRCSLSPSLREEALNLQYLDAPRQEGSGQTPRLPDAIASLGPPALSVAVGINLMFWAVLWWKPPVVDSATLTIQGIFHVRPERDVLIYVVAGVVAVTLCGVLASFARMYSPAPQAAWRRALELASPLIALVLTAAATAAFLRFRGEVMAGVRRPVKYLFVFGTLVTVGLVSAWLCRKRTAVGADPSTPDPLTGRRLPIGVVDVAVAVAVPVLVYVPRWRLLSGKALAEVFLHLDFFAMGPALAFRAGAALGTDVNSNYGLGWGVLVSALGAVDRLGYGRLIQLEMVYACLYFVGVYALVRMLTGSRPWAVAATALGVYFSLFAWWPTDLVSIWRFPPATVLRWAFDVWFFLAALMYLRTRKPAWLVAAGGLVGLAIFFQTDTGTYLALGFAFLCACMFRLAQGARPSPGLVLRAWALGAGVLLLGMAFASRMTVFTDLGFWHGWLENLKLSVKGATLVPLAGTAGVLPIVMFVVLATVYLLVAGYAAQQMVRERLSPTAALLGTIAVYGFLTLTFFVGRSNADNLFRPAVPFAVVLAGCGGVVNHVARMRASTAGEHWRGAAVRVTRMAPALAAAMAIVMLVSDAGFRIYPNVLGPEPAGARDAARCLQTIPRDICGLRVADAPMAEDIRAVAGRLANGPGPRPTVAVVDEYGPIFHLLGNDKPWGAYQPLIPHLFTRHQVDVAVRHLERDPPDLVVMRSPDEHAPFSDDIWRAFRAPVEQLFVFDSSYGPYEIWRRRSAG